MTRLRSLALIASVAIAAVSLGSSSAPRPKESAVSSAQRIDTAVAVPSIDAVSVMIAPQFAIAHRAVMVLDTVRMVAVHFDSAPERPIALRFIASDSSAPPAVPANARLTCTDRTGPRTLAATRLFARRLT